MSNRLLMNESALKRFYNIATVDLETGCWLFTTYSFTLQDGRVNPVYKVAYETFVDIVPAKLDLGHTCRNDTGSYKRTGILCGFWEHVRPITRSQNLREVQGTIETCKRNHPRTSENTRTEANGTTSCKVCRRIRDFSLYGGVCCVSCGYSICRCGKQKYEAVG